MYRDLEGDGHVYFKVLTHLESPKNPYNISRRLVGNWQEIQTHVPQYNGGN